MNPMETGIPNDLITARQAVEAFNPLIKTVGAFYDLAKRGKFATYGAGRTIYASRAEVAAALKRGGECQACGKLSRRGKLIFASEG